MELVHAANHYIEDSAPWAVAKDPERAGELADIITSLLESIRICAHLLAPFMPETSAEVLRRMSLGDEAGTDDLAAACAWGGLAGGVEVTKGDALFRASTPRRSSGRGRVGTGEPGRHARPAGGVRARHQAQPGPELPGEQPRDREDHGPRGGSRQKTGCSRWALASARSRWRFCPRPGRVVSVEMDRELSPVLSAHAAAHPPSPTSWAMRCA